MGACRCTMGVVLHVERGGIEKQMGRSLGKIRRNRVRREEGGERREERGERRDRERRDRERRDRER